MRIARGAGSAANPPAPLAIVAVPVRPIAIHHARVVRTSLAKTASDHLPLVIDFHLR